MNGKVWSCGRQNRNREEHVVVSVVCDMLLDLPLCVPILEQRGDAVGHVDCAQTHEKHDELRQKKKFLHYRLQRKQKHITRLVQHVTIPFQ